MRSQIFAVAAAILVSMLAACGRSDDDLVYVDLALPAAATSLAPNFTSSPEGVVYVSWLETEGDFSRLVVSRWLGTKWSAKRVVAEGENWFVNWADFPSLIALDEKRLMAQWLVRNGPGTYAYDVRLGQSLDGGVSWQELGVLHDDATETEHGFATFYSYADSLGERQAGIVWLDGRNMLAGTSHAMGSMDSGMSLRQAHLDGNGVVQERLELDSLACDCCQTAAVVTGDDVLVAYRDRVVRPGAAGDHREIRDIMLMRREGGSWRQQGYINEDNWGINGCPVNGPAMAGDGENVAIAWYTEAGNRPVVKAGVSGDRGRNFKTFEVSDDSPMGRVDIAFLESAVAVSWLARVADGAEIRLQLFDSGGRPLTSAQRVIGIKASRAAGFPQLIAANDELLVAWTEVRDDAHQARQAHVARLLIKPR